MQRTRSARPQPVSSRMKLESPTRTSFCLEILGYQFPRVETEEYDSNWLVIRITVSHPKGNWACIDPSLLTYEVARLADWLEAIHNNETVQQAIRFVEPNLEFHLTRSERGKDKVLRVRLRLEASPPWLESDVVGERDFWIQFPIAEIDLLAASRQLREQLQQFPQRTGV